MSLVRRFLTDETAAQVVEYGLVLGLVSLVAVAALISSGETINLFWTGLSDCVAGVTVFGIPSFAGC